MSAPPNISLPPPNYDSRASGVVACAVVLLVVPTVAVALRVWSRAVATQLTFWWDDWSIIATLTMSHAFLATNIHWTTIGLGKHSWMIPMNQIARNTIANYVALMFYIASITMIKISALLLYARLFRSDFRFKITLWAIGSVVTAWWVVASIVPWIFCHPIHKDVDPLMKGKCDSSIGWFTASAFVNAFLDLVVLVLPMPIIWKLHLKTARKVSVTLAFLLGYCSAFLSLARFIIIVRKPKLLYNKPGSDSSWDLIPLLYLSMLEAPLAILALCGPLINQLISRVMKLNGLKSLLTSPWRSLNGTGGSSSLAHRDKANPKTGFAKAKIGSRHDQTAWTYSGMNSTTAIADKTSVNEQPPDIPMGVISINQDVNIARDHERHLV